MFDPKYIFFEKESLDYEIGRKVYDYFKQRNRMISILNKNSRVTGVGGESDYEIYSEAKKTLLVGIRKTLNFQSCKPSAHYQLPLATSCTGMCEYCYLNTQLGRKPYVRMYVNIDEILDKARSHIDEREPQITIFEGSATSDPVPFEPYSGLLKQCIEYFSTSDFGRFRFVTKFTDIDDLVDISHNNHTEIRFSINSDRVIKEYEHGTATLDNRLKAAKKVATGNYPIGFIIAPVILYNGWKDDYEIMLQNLSKSLENINNKITFEVVSHRFTARAKSVILDIYPETTLPMNEEERKFKFGQFGYGKYVYSKEELDDMGQFFRDKIAKYFSNYEILYTI